MVVQYSIFTYITFVVLVLALEVYLLSWCAGGHSKLPRWPGSRSHLSTSSRRNLEHMYYVIHSLHHTHVLRHTTHIDVTYDIYLGLIKYVSLVV